MWQTKYASAVPKNLGLRLNFGRAVKAISSLGVRSPWPGMNWRGHVIFLAASRNNQTSSFGLIKDNMELSRNHYAVPHDRWFRKDCNTF